MKKYTYNEIIDKEYIGYYFIDLRYNTDNISTYLTISEYEYNFENVEEIIYESNDNIITLGNRYLTIYVKNKSTRQVNIDYFAEDVQGYIKVITIK